MKSRFSILHENTIPNNFSSLPKRARDALVFAGFKSRREVREAIIKGVLWAKLQPLRNFSNGSFADILLWSGVTEADWIIAGIQKLPKPEQQKIFAHFVKDKRRSRSGAKY